MTPNRMPNLKSKSTPKGCLQPASVSQPARASQSQHARASQRPPQPEPVKISQSQPQLARANQLKTRVNQSQPAENQSQLEPPSLTFEGVGPVVVFLRSVFLYLKRKQETINRTLPYIYIHIYIYIYIWYTAAKVP